MRQITAGSVVHFASAIHTVGPIVGGEDHLAFDVLNGRMLVLEGADPVPTSSIQDAVRRTGMTAELWGGQRKESKREDDRHRRVQVWLTALSGLFTLVGFGVHASSEGAQDAFALFSSHIGAQSIPIAELAGYALGIVFGARYVVVKAWYASLRLRPDMNLLMTIAIIGAMAINEWFEGATVAFLFSLSLTLESWSVGRARRAIAALLDLAPPTVRVKRNGGEVSVPAAEAQLATRFIVRPGERIALDGRVVIGNSSVNQAPITGESMPVVKQPGGEVFAGTINGEAVLEIESTRLASDTTLARIINLVEEAHTNRAQSEQWVEKFARIYTPVVLFSALLVALVPPLALDAAWAEWIYRSLVLLVIGCPCALVISTPVAIVAALASAARQGILIKGGTFVEIPAGLKAIAFDKTGTLTLGKPEVVDVIPLSGHTENELIERAAALEAQSTHPLAQAILTYAERHRVPISPAGDAKALPGRGVTGTFRGDGYWLGSHRYLVERGQSNADITGKCDALERDGRTVVVIGNNTHVCGMISVADTIRPRIRETLREIRTVGVLRIVMLTGDNRVTAEAIGQEAGVDEIRSELLPQDKVAELDRLVQQYGSVAMVGDGVNDAPAMARASLGIAMGAIGSDAAIETADIALMTDDLEKLPWLINHSRRALGVIRQNIAFALGVKAIFVVLTFVGYATLWGAIAADVGASLLVVFNALRLLRGPVK
jgi:Cd2+/Zn2+-exporting ATPase